MGREQNLQTKGWNVKKEEKTLLNRLEKYKENHLLFLHDFQIHYSNSMSEKDLRICKNCQKTAKSEGVWTAALKKPLSSISAEKRLFIL